MRRTAMLVLHCAMSIREAGVGRPWGCPRRAWEGRRPPWRRLPGAREMRETNKERKVGLLFKGKYQYLVEANRRSTERGIDPARRSLDRPQLRFRERTKMCSGGDRPQTGVPSDSQNAGREKNRTTWKGRLGPRLPRRAGVEHQTYAHGACPALANIAPAATSSRDADTETNVPARFGRARTPSRRNIRVRPACPALT